MAATATSAEELVERRRVNEETEDDSSASSSDEGAESMTTLSSGGVRDDGDEDDDVPVHNAGPETTLRSRLRNCLHDFETAAHQVCEDVDFSAVAKSVESAAHQAVEAVESAAHHAVESAEEFARKVWECVHFSHLPAWLQDNDFLHRWHRPPLPSFTACFKSIFRVHTETGNIWTHLIGCLAFIAVGTFFLTRPAIDLDLQEKLVFSAFFAGAILCLGMSFAFHTVSCHSEFVGKLFSKLDYCGIAFLIMGSFVPWLYYGFYCEFLPKLIYLTVTTVLGLCAITVSLWDRFSEPQYRPLRAGVFIGFGLSGVVPAAHYLATEGWFKAATETAMGSLVLMAVLYISGALLYAWRVPERFFPGKFDLWGHSHQIFHLLVIAAAFVHYHGISEMAVYRLTAGRVCGVEAAAMASAAASSSSSPVVSPLMYPQ